MKKETFKGTLIFLVFGMVVLTGYNIKYNTSFFQAPIYTILNLIVAVFFAYFLTQRKNDERKLKEKAENLIDKIQIVINDKRFVHITSKEDIEFLLMMQRSISNRVEILIGLKDKLIFPKEIEYIKENFTSYKEIIGNHFQDVDYLSKSEKDLYNKIMLIDSKLDEMRIKLYQ